jgi:hypothetical protein
MQTLSSPRPTRQLLGVIAIAALGLGACASDKKASSTDAPAAATAAGAITQNDAASIAPVATDAAAAELAAPTPADNNVSLAVGANAPTQIVPVGDAALPPLSGVLAITATVTVEVGDVRETLVTLPELIASYGGVVYDSEVSVGEPETATATVTIKVPPASLEKLIAGLTGAGRLLDRSQQTEEVSSQLTDLGARISTAQASVDRVRILLAAAKNLQEITSIEGELTVRETVLEQLLAQQRNLQDRVATSTLTVVLTPAPPVVVEEVEPDLVLAASQQIDDDSIGGAFSAGWHNFTNVVRNLAVFVGYTLPFFTVMCLVGGVIWVIRQRILKVTGLKVTGPASQAP